MVFVVGFWGFNELAPKRQKSRIVGGMMDASKFTNERTGDLVSLSSHQSQYAFIPRPLPPEWEFPSSLWPLVVEAMRALGVLDGTGRNLPNPELLLFPLQEREALCSSSLEGTHATPAQMLLFKMRGESKAKANDPVREVHNYSNALRNGHHYLIDNPLSLDLVCQLHGWLLEGVRGSDKAPGMFRDIQVQVGSDARYVPPPPSDMRQCLDLFENEIQRADFPFDALVWCYMVHYQFEAIHPFRDGNGRVGRLLLALMTGKLCGLTKPWLYMSAFFEKHKDEYVELLFNVSSSGLWEDWIRFCLRGTIQQANDAIKRCSLLHGLKEQMHEKTKSIGSGRLHGIIDRLFGYPALTIPQVAKEFDVGYPAAKGDVDNLIEAGILFHAEESHHPKVFFARDIVGIAYADLSD